MGQRRKLLVMPALSPHDDLVHVQIRRLLDGKGHGALLQGYINGSMLPRG
jgi:hypothetical protein